MLKILFVDDESQTLELLRDMFSPSCTVFTAARGIDAHKILLADVVDLIVIDILLAGTENGCEVAQFIGNDFPQLKIYLMTGMDQKSVAIYEKHFQVINKAELILNFDESNPTACFKGLVS